MIDIRGKTAFITGSSRGIGQQIAIGLAKLNCNLVIHGRTKDNCQKTLKLLKDYDITVHVVYGELSNEEQVKKVIAQVKKLEIPIDILYNNAAVMTAYREDYWTHNWEDWSLSMQVNVFAVYSFCAAFIPAMIANHFGRVINLVSGIKEQPELMPYAASKWALVKLTEDIAVKLKDTPVRINKLDPGWLKTDLGGEYADHSVEDVLPGALAPALIENDGSNGQCFFAID